MARTRTRSGWRSAVGTAGLLLAVLMVCAVALQAAFALRIALMAVVAPQSTSFQRSEAVRLLRAPAPAAWSQQWVDASRISPLLKRAVIASEDAGFAGHDGIEWDAVERAWARNQAAQAAAERRNRPSARLVGGSTITQQLAKNLFLSGERTVVRKAQEAVIALLLERLLGKPRILEIYLNSVEWGEGVFGAEAAARHYFRSSADRLGAFQAARLAVMLPAPKRFERRPESPFLMARAAAVAARMGDVQLP